MKKISIIIPTYQPKEYLFEALESVRNQNLNTSFYEVLVILNGPKDKQTEIKNYIEKNQLINFKFFYSDIPSVSNARNIGLKHSKNDYIFFLDDDDLISKNYLKELLKISNERTLGISNLVPFEGEVNNLKEGYLSEFFKKNENKKNKNIIIMRKGLSAIGGKLIHKKIIGRTLFNIYFSKGEDSLFLTEISSRIESFHISKSNVIYYRRIRENSVTRKKISKLKKIKEFNKNITGYLKLFLHKDINKLFLVTRLMAQVKKI